MKRYIVLCVAVAAMLAVLYVFDYFSLESGISGAVVAFGEDKKTPELEAFKLPPGDSCYLEDGYYVCLSTKARYQSRNACLSNCEGGGFADFYKSAKCAARGEAPQQDKSCCIVTDISCSFCGNKCYATCPNSECKAPDGISCDEDSQCSGGSCVEDVCDSTLPSESPPSAAPAASAVEPVACALKDGSYQCTYTNRLYSSLNNCNLNCIASSTPSSPSGSAPSTTPPSSGASSGVADSSILVDGVDLAVVGSKTRAESFEGSKFRLKAVVRNRGRVSVDSEGRYDLPGGGFPSGAQFGVSASVLSGEKVVCSDASVNRWPLASGEEKSLTIPLVIPGSRETCSLASGAYNLVVKVDSNIDALDVDLNNNVVMIPFQFGTGSGSCPGDAPVGFRTPDGVYCDPSKVFRAQKLASASCSNSFECLSNLCLSNVCVATCVLANSLTGEVMNVVTAGTAWGGLYCDVGSDGVGVIKQQTDTGSCSENFECVTGICGARNCVPESKRNDVLCMLDVIPNC